MKNFFFTLILFFLTLPAQAADKWTATDTTLQLTYLTLHGMDWAQTLYIARHPETNRETNNILGEHPSEGRVNSYFAITGLGHTAVSYMLSKPYRTIWQSVWIVNEYDWVQHNRRHGIGISLHF